MDQQNPLTDPTSFIAYRLANGDSSLGAKPGHPAASNTRMASPGIVALASAGTSKPFTHGHFKIARLGWSDGVSIGYVVGAPFLARALLLDSWSR